MMDKFWPRILPGYNNNDSFENSSIDVALKNCYNYFDTAACIRNALLSFLGCVTLFACVIRIIKLHHMCHPQIHQYLVFYFASLEMLFLTLKWIALTRYFQLEFTASYLKLIQFLLLCHYFWLLVSRILHRRRIITWCILPLLCGFFGVLSAVTVMGLLSHQTTWIECLAPHWLLLSVAELVCTHIYILAGMYITKNINSLSALDSFKSEQKRELWSVILTYAFSSLTSLVYYSIIQKLGDVETGCSGIFAHAQEIYSPVYAGFMVIKYLLPIWVMLLVFYPTRGCMSSEEERFLGFSTSGSTTSTFTPRYHENYRQLIVPVDYHFSEGTSNLRKSSSSPALFAQPALTPIYEEDRLLTPQYQYESYGATASCSPPHFEPLPRSSARVRTRHSSGHPSKHRSHGQKIIVSLNQGPDEIQSVTPSSGEKA